MKDEKYTFSDSKEEAKAFLSQVDKIAEGEVVCPFLRAMCSRNCALYFEKYDGCAIHKIALGIGLMRGGL